MDFLHFTRYNVSNILILMNMHMNYMRAVGRPQGPRRGFSSWGANGCERISLSKLGGSGRMFLWENFKFKSSEMAINAYKTANVNINL